MWHVTKLALRNRVATLLVALLLAGASIWALVGLKMELIPNIEFPYTTVITVYPQASPDTVADKVTTPIEGIIADRWTGKGLKHLTSTSAEGVSIIFAEFEYGTSMKDVASSINEGLGTISLPAEVVNLAKMNPALGENPRIVPINMSIMPLIMFSLSGDLPSDQLKQIADTQIIPELKKVQGVVSVDSEGGDKDQVIIAPDPDKMTVSGVSLLQIAALLAPKTGSLAEVEQTLLKDGVVLGDVALVSQGPAPTSVVTRVNGQPSVGITVMKEDNANTVDVANALNDKAKTLQANLGDGLKLEPVFDQSQFIKSSISQLWQKAVIGGVLAILVVFVFLWAVRASLVTAISIPMSMLFGFFGMRLAGITINILTLSAMSIAVGRLIDDSIVMVEVIFRRMQKGEQFKDAAIGGAKEIATPITSATLATVAIFIPLMFVGGIVGEMFIPFALTVTFAMIASLLVALMVVPTLSRFLAGNKTKRSDTVPWYSKTYTRALKWALVHRAIVLVVALVLFVGSLGLLPAIGTSFMSGMSEETITVSVQMPPGTDVAATSETAAQVEALLQSNKEVKSFSTTVGTSTSLFGAMSTATGGGGNTATVNVYLKPGADMAKEADSLRLACKAIAGGQGIAVFTSDSSGGMESMGSGLSISVQGADQEQVAQTAGMLAARLSFVGGLANLQSSITVVVPKLDIKLDQAKVAALGLSAAQQQLLQLEFYLLMEGGTLPDKTMDTGNESYSIYVKGIAGGLTGAEQAKGLRIGFPQSVALGDVANAAVTDVPTHISHTDQHLSATISASITDKNVGAVNRAVQEQIDAMPSHPGVEIKMGGVAEEMGDTFSRMGIAILSAIVIAFLVVVVMMRSVINPAMIMISLPLASIGALLGLLVSGHTLGLSAMMGVLMLVGIVLTNAIVLISLVDHLRTSGMSVNDALIEGGRTRIRPILMTALTTILAMTPLAIGVESGTLLAAELAVVVIGGMFSSTLLTVLVIPVIYSLVHGRRRQIPRKPREGF